MTRSFNQHGPHVRISASCPPPVGIVDAFDLPYGIVLSIALLASICTCVCVYCQPPPSAGDNDVTMYNGAPELRRKITHIQNDFNYHRWARYVLVQCMVLQLLRHAYESTLRYCNYIITTLQRAGCRIVNMRRMCALLNVAQTKRTLGARARTSRRGAPIIMMIIRRFYCAALDTGSV